ncbi:MAG: glycoside hydrolase family 25 protein [Clostridiales bacterium]|nr:glycoside hydrolase family 25 protein [Clostridiales bacterium]
MKTYTGIDVSEYQGTIDWKKIKNDGKDFAIIRCGYGRFPDQIDSKFEENYREAKKAGINVGTYLFSYATSVQQAQAEAKNMLGFIKGKQFEYPVVYDVETNAHKKLGKKALSENVRAFCETVEDAGYYVSIYANLDFLNNFLEKSVTQRYDIWLAQWAKKPTYKGKYGMWQYSASGRLPGTSTAVDLDMAYKDYPSIMRKNGLNGFKKESVIRKKNILWK